MTHRSTPSVVLVQAQINAAIRRVSMAIWRHEHFMKSHPDVELRLTSALAALELAVQAAEGPAVVSPLVECLGCGKGTERERLEYCSDANGYRCAECRCERLKGVAS